jgi:guanyl-specific ribonuclease Sa
MVSVSRVIPRVLRHYLSGGAHHSHQQQQRDAAAAAAVSNSSSSTSSSSSSSSTDAADSFDDSVSLVDDVDGVLRKSEGVVRDLLVEIMAEIPSAVEQVQAHYTHTYSKPR